MQVNGTVLTIRQVDVYHVLTVVAPGIAERFRPGQFVAVSAGAPDAATLLRRCLFIHDVKPEYGGTVEVVFRVRGRGTSWLAGRRVRDSLDLVGPLGRPFPLPRDPVNCLLVGGGYGSAPLLSLADALQKRGCRVDFVLGGGAADRVFGALRARRIGETTTVTTGDGSLGVRGRVTDVLPTVITDARSEVIYACGPMAMLRAVAAVAAEFALPAQVAVEELMPCGIGVCMACVIPVVGDDGVTRMARACVDGPVFRGDRVRFDDVGTIPFDALGAPGGSAR